MSLRLMVELKVPSGELNFQELSVVADAVDVGAAGFADAGAVGFADAVDAGFADALVAGASRRAPAMTVVISRII